MVLDADHAFKKVRVSWQWFKFQLEVLKPELSHLMICVISERDFAIACVCFSLMIKPVAW